MVCLCASFSLVKDGETIFHGYSEHCYFTTENAHMRTQFDTEEGFFLIDGTRVSEYFTFSLDSVCLEDVGDVIGFLTKEFPCLIMFNGWWEIYIPVQYVGSLTLYH